MMASFFRQLLLFAACFIFPLVLSCQKDTLFVDGSNGVRPLVVEVAKAFEKNFPGIKIEIGEGMSTHQRIDALKKGEIDIAMASHGIDIASFTKDGLQVHWFAKMAIVIGLHHSVGLKKLSTDQLVAIYSGEVQNWMSLGGPDLAVVPLGRPSDEVDMEILLEHIQDFPDPDPSGPVIMHQKSGSLARALAHTPGAIGMTAAVRQAQAKDQIQALIIDGVKPSLRMVSKDKYPFQRNAYLITRGLKDAKVKRFIQFFKSKTARKVLAKNAAVPTK